MRSRIRTFAVCWMFAVLVSLGAGIPLLAGGEVQAYDGPIEDHTTFDCAFKVVD